MTIPYGRRPCRGEFIRPPSSIRPIASEALVDWATHWPVAFRRSGGGRRVLARDQALEAQPDLADKALKVALTSGFALLGESLLAISPKGTKRSCPCIRVSLRSTSLIPSLLRGSPRKGHPWPFTAFAASMPLTPLRSDSIRPPERGVRRRLAGRAMEKPETMSSQGGLTDSCGEFVGWKTAKHFPPRSIPQLISDLAHQKRRVSFALPTLRSLKGRTTSLLHGPSDAAKSPLSGGRAQVVWKGLSGMDAARAALGHGWPVAAGPWNVTGTREPRRSRGRMQGQAFLLTFSASGKSESPSRAKPMPQPIPPIGDTSGSKSQNASRGSTTRTAPRLQPDLAPLARRQTPNRHYKRLLVCA